MMSDKTHCVVCVIGKDYFFVKKMTSDDRLYKEVPVNVLENGEKLTLKGFIAAIGM
jgi:hypothetical protein